MENSQNTNFNLYNFMKPNCFALTLLTLLCSASFYGQNLSTRKGGHCFSMDVSNYMTKTFDLNDVASLQYQNTAKETYAVVIHDTKEELELAGMKFMNATEYLNAFITDYKIEAKNRKLSSIKEFSNNGHGHAQVELSWNEEEVDFYMLITIAETPSTFYNVMCWTVLENKELYKNDFVEMSKSIKD